MINENIDFEIVKEKIINDLNKIKSNREFVEYLIFLSEGVITSLMIENIMNKDLNDKKDKSENDKKTN